MKKYINKIVVIGAVAMSLQLNAQQNFQLSQYTNSSNLLNPVFSGMEDQTEIGAGYRSQYAGWTGAGASPSTFYLSGSTVLGSNSTASTSSLSLGMRTGSDVQVNETYEEGKQASDIKHGLGGYVYSDKYGHFKRTSFGGSYAAHIPVSDAIKLGVGGMMGLTSIGVESSALTVVDAVNDDSYNALLATNGSRMSVDFNIGLMLYSKDFFVGYSGYQFFGNKVYDKSSNLEGKLVFQNNIIAGYNYEVNDDINVIPTLLVKMVGGVKPTFDIGAKLMYQKKYWGGIGVRNEDAVVVLLGAQLTDMFKLGYSYDLNTSEIKNHSSGGHEITLGLSLAKKGEDIKNNYLW